MSRTFRSFLLFTAVLAGALSSGCSDAGTPTVAPVGFPAFSESDVEIIAKFKERPQTTYGWAKAWIGPRGGRLDFLGFAIEVPAGAVDKVTMFSIQVPMDRTGAERVMAEFGPHNRTFAQPVIIELPLRNTTIESSTAPTIVWWNDAWVNMGAAVTADGQRLRTAVDHFSTYGTTTARVGTITVSGG
ncbi:MAG TPA: hypothetical protein VFX98_03280 [Longimicrobiaceae bacterium]|nr:hypothetical protein [Longimicrobiaceae bacterium]